MYTNFLCIYALGSRTRISPNITIPVGRKSSLELQRNIPLSAGFFSTVVSDRHHRPSMPSCATAIGKPPAGTFRATLTSGSALEWLEKRSRPAFSSSIRFQGSNSSSSLGSSEAGMMLDPDAATLSWRVEEALSRLLEADLTQLSVIPRVPLQQATLNKLHITENKFRVLRSLLLSLRFFFSSFFSSFFFSFECTHVRFGFFPLGFVSFSFRAFGTLLHAHCFPFCYPMLLVAKPTQHAPTQLPRFLDPLCISSASPTLPPPHF